MDTVGKTNSVRERVGEAEWQVRKDLAALYRLVALFGWDDLIFTHITAKVPGTEHFLINPYGMMFDEITASSLVKIDLHGRKVMESEYDINPAGFTIHSCIHAARKDAMCVLHTHSINGVAVSAQKKGCCRCRSSPSSCCARSAITITRAWRSTRTSSRAWCAIWAATTTSSCATTAC